MTITALFLHSATEIIPTSKIQQSWCYPSERDAHFCETEIASLPYSSEFVQVLSTGELCSPLQIIRESLSCRKITTLGACAQRCSAMPIPHSSLNPLLTPCCHFRHSQVTIRCYLKVHCLSHNKAYFFPAGSKHRAGIRQLSPLLLAE